MRLPGWFRRWSRADQVHETDTRVWVDLGPGVTMSIELVATSDGVEVEYQWPTSLSAEGLIRKCTPFSKNRRFAHRVEVTVFPREGTDGYQVFDVDDYLKRAAELDSSASSVRFSTEALNDFSVTWVPARGAREELRGHASAMFAEVQEMMQDMIAESVPRFAAQHVKPLIKAGRKLHPGVAA